MIRDNDQIETAIRFIQASMNSGNKDAVKDIPQQLLDLLETLKYQPDRMIQGNMKSRIDELERDKRLLEDQMRIVIINHNSLVDEFNKVKRIMEFVMAQKETTNA